MLPKYEHTQKRSKLVRYITFKNWRKARIGTDEPEVLAEAISEAIT